MDIQLDTLLKGKQTRIKDKEYFETEAYVNPFLERMSKITSDFRVKVELPEQITLTKDGDVNFEDITYNRVWIQAILPEQFDVDNHQDVIGMVYGIDTRKPIVKFYRGGLNKACTNLCVFNPEMLNVSELEPESAINYSFLRNAMSMTDETNLMLKKLSEMEYKKDDIYADLGHWVDNCINSKINMGFGSVKLAESAPIDVYKDLFYDEKSKYYTTDNVVDGFTVYNAFTDLITQDKRDLVNKFEKTLLIKDVMGI